MPRKRERKRGPRRWKIFVRRISTEGREELWLRRLDKTRDGECAQLSPGDELAERGPETH